MGCQCSFSGTGLFQLFKIVEFGDIVFNVKPEADCSKLLIFRVVVILIDFGVELGRLVLYLLFCC